jgi:regulator of protease activity HflC (stomatin/prohibitin superfamily)
MDSSVLFITFLFIFVIFGLVTLAKGARTVRQYEKGLITRLGKYHGMAPSGSRLSCRSSTTSCEWICASR